MRAHVGLFALTAAFVLLCRVAALPTPLVYQQIIDKVLPGGSLPSLFVAIGALAGLLLLGRVLGVFQAIALARLQQAVLHDVRVVIYEHLQRLDLLFHGRHKTGGLLSRIMSDAAVAQSVVSYELFNVFVSAIEITVVGGLLLWLNPGLTLFSALVFPVLVVLVAIFQRPIYRISKAMQERRELLSAKLQENLSAIRVIQAMALENQRLELTRATSQQLAATTVRMEVLGSSINLLTIALTDVPLTLLVWGYGGYLVIRGELTVGALLAFSQYLMMLYAPVIQIFRFRIQLETARAAVDRIYEVLDAEPAVRDATGALALEVHKGGIRFEHVSLGYQNGERAITDLTLDIAPGEVLGVVGPSGAGKTTLVNGLMRFLAPEQGRVLIDDQDVSKVSLASLRASIGLVAQDVFLFSDTVQANIALAKPTASAQAVATAARAAAAHEFIEALPVGYETVLGERGASLSGGQRQRISLARVFLQDPPIFVFDEATSALDSQSEAAIQAALGAIVKGRTTLIIAHRFSTLRLCHRIAVLEAGRLVELGTWEELLSRDGLFAALAKAAGEHD
ncbi:MAG: ABC transporter ATP-binding protein/permease [Myxococcota bacterium]|nr:ABC transporter ATP-binding protein/permease [Myxococcota bacterium]